MPTAIAVVGNISIGDKQGLRFTSGGKAVFDFSLAQNDRRKVGDEWEDETTWYKVTVWEKQAENAAASLSKGDRVFVYGTVKNREYELDGEKRYSLEITAEHIGPELRWATAEVTRNEKESSGGSSNGGGRGRSTRSQVPDPMYGDEEPF